MELTELKALLATFFSDVKYMRKVDLLTDRIAQLEADTNGLNSSKKRVPADKNYAKPRKDGYAINVVPIKRGV